MLSTLTCLVSSASVYCVAHMGKNCRNVAILTKLSHLGGGGSCVHPFYESGPNLTTNRRLTVYAYTPNFIWIRLLCHFPGTKKPAILGKFWHLGASVHSPFTNKSQIWCARADLGVRLRPRFRLDRFYKFPLDRYMYVCMYVCLYYDTWQTADEITIGLHI